MKMNNQLLKLVRMIQKAQVTYHITGDGQVADVYSVSTLYPSGTDVTYMAKRAWDQRGLSYNLYKQTTSIAKGYKEVYIGRTNEWGREYVEII